MRTLYRRKIDIRKWNEKLLDESKNIAIPIMPEDIESNFCFAVLDLDNTYILGISPAAVEYNFDVMRKVLQTKTPLYNLSNMVLMSDVLDDTYYYSGDYFKSIYARPKKIVLYDKIVYRGYTLVNYILKEKYKDVDDTRILYDYSGVQLSDDAHSPFINNSLKKLGDDVMNNVSKLDTKHNARNNIYSTQYRYINV